MKKIEESLKALFYIKKYLLLGRYFLEERFINFFRFWLTSATLRS